MAYQEAEVRGILRQKIRELAARDGHDNIELKDEDIISQTGYLDSGSIVELIIFIERGFNVSVKQDDITQGHLESVERIIGYLRGARVI